MFVTTVSISVFSFSNRTTNYSQSKMYFINDIAYLYLFIFITEPHGIKGCEILFIIVAFIKMMYSTEVSIQPRDLQVNHKNLLAIYLAICTLSFQIYSKLENSNSTPFHTTWFSYGDKVVHQLASPTRGSFDPTLVHFTKNFARRGLQ